MPNWVENDVKIIGEEENISTFVKDFTEKGFECVSPMPEVLKEYNTETSIHWEVLERASKSPFENPQKEEIDEFIESIRKIIPSLENDNLKQAAKELIKCLKESGYISWYQFAVANWGTKWQPWGVSYNDRKKRLFFYTAWSTPIPFFVKASQKYNLTFRIVACDEMFPFLYQFEIKNGEVTFYKDYSKIFIERQDKSFQTGEPIDLSDIYAFLHDFGEQTDENVKLM